MGMLSAAIGPVAGVVVQRYPGVLRDVFSSDVDYSRSTRLPRLHGVEFPEPFLLFHHLFSVVCIT